MRKSLLLIGAVMQLAMFQPALAQEMPDECKGFQSAKLEDCVAVHKASDDCKTTSDASRIKCAKQKIGLTVEPAKELKKCGVQRGIEKKVCETVVKNKVISSVTFSLDDLAIKAGNATKISEAKVNKFISVMESAKQKFNLAKTYSERVKIVQKAQTDWTKFVKANKGKITTKNNLDAALKDLKATK